MAARYWVGGSGTWDASTTTNWSATSGGTGGASVPTSADTVFIDTGTPTITTSVAITVISITMTATGATLSLGNTLTMTGALTVSAGTFTTNNNAVSASSLSSTGTGVRAINLGSSTCTFSSSPPIDFTVPTNLTFSCGTSSLTFSSNSTQPKFGGQTFYNLSFTGTVGSTHTITTGSTATSFFTVNNLTLTGPAAASQTSFGIDGTVVISGTWSTTGTAGNRRLAWYSSTVGLTYNVVVNATPSLTDIDFRDIQVTGTAAPISGTRIGNLAGCSGITFSAPKTVYWNLTGSTNWLTSTGWAATSGGTPAVNNYPLAQDTAVFDNTGAATTVTIPDGVYIGTLDMSARTTAMTLATSLNTVYILGDWKFGSGVSCTGTQGLSFVGRGTQTITSSGKTFSQFITVDSPGGTVQLADALTSSNATTGIQLTNGTFYTNNKSLTVLSLLSSNSNVRTFNFGSSTVTLSGGTPITFTTSTNLTFNAGTSQINCSFIGFLLTVDCGSGVAFYNLAFTAINTNTKIILGTNSFNTLSTTGQSLNGMQQIQFGANQTIGTLSIGAGGATGYIRTQFMSNTNGTPRNLTISAVSGATDVDFRDIIVSGAVVPLTGTRLGNCGGNLGITFDAPKTVYWNNVTGGNWGSANWAATSGGATSATNFPLAQDTAVFDQTGLGNGTTITLNYGYNLGSINTSAMTTNTVNFSSSVQGFCYGNITGSAVTSWSTNLVFSGRGTQLLNSGGSISFGIINYIDSYSGTVQLTNTFTTIASSGFVLNSGTLDAAGYSVNIGFLTCNTSSTCVLKMGSGTWTLSGTGTIWNIANSNLTLIKGTSNIVLSDNSTVARTFAGGGYSYGKLTIGGTTSISTTTISGANQFDELASTKTVAHNIAFPAGVTTTVGKWSITGTSGNVVTLISASTPTPFVLSIAGATPASINYLSLSYCTLSTTSPAEFFVGANSTNTVGNTRVTFTAAPAPRTLYWVGGTGNWSSTTSWSTSSGGSSGAAVPTSLDSVIFNSSSGASGYTVTVDPTQARCASLTIGAPATGTLTFAGTGGLAIAGNVSIAASGVTITYTGAITLSGASNYTLTTNGVALSSAIEVNGVACTWTLGSALTNTGGLTVTNGTFATANYNTTIPSISSANFNSRTINLGASTLLLSSTNPITITSSNLTLNPGTSTITLNSSGATFAGSNLPWYNLSFTNTSSSFFAISGANSFNNVSIVGRASAGITPVTISANQTIFGTLTLSAGTDATCRTFVQSDTLRTPRTLICNAISATDIDFRDITIAGTAAPASGTRLGDCKGNTGITFVAGINKYWNLATGGNWGGATGWATTGGGTPAINNFPLPQDTAIFQSTGLNSGATVTINDNYNIGTIDMSARTSNTMTLATGTTAPVIYGNWINGTGTTLSGTGNMTFAGRGNQTITNAGVAFTQPMTFNSPGGSISLQDALTNTQNSASALTLTQGTFNANNYNVTLSQPSSGVSLTGTGTRTLAVGSGTWTIAGTGTVWDATTATNLTVTGTGILSLTSASSKTFIGGGISYSGITLNHGGAGTLTITGNNVFANITNTNIVAATISLGATTQTVINLSASGTAGNLLTISGTSGASSASLIYLGTGTISQDYIVPTYLRVYNLANTWYAGTHSVNSGSLGYAFTSAPSPTPNPPWTVVGAWSIGPGWYLGA